MAESVRVLLISSSFQVRGTSSYTLRLAEHLPSEDIVPAIICPNASRVSAERRTALRIRELPNLGMPVWGRVAQEFLLRELQEHPPDLLHVQSRGLLPQASWLARRLNLPLVLTVHDFPGPRERLRSDHDVLARVIAVSGAVRLALLEHASVPAEHIHVIHPGVETDRHSDVAPVLDPEHEPVVGTAGPLEAVKGLEFFLAAANVVAERHPRVQFLIAGSGPEERSLRRQARDLGIAGRVTFIPNLFDFTAALTAMDVFCLPSLRQGLGSVMLEAMALGRPVIASAVDGVSSVVVDNETGLLVPPRDCGRLAERISELLSDPVRARAVGEASRQLIRENFNVAEMVQRTAALYRDVLSENPGAPGAVDNATGVAT